MARLLALLIAFWLAPIACGAAPSPAPDAPLIVPSAAPGDQELARQTAPRLEALTGGMAAALHPETRPIDTGAFTLKSVRWQKGAGGKPAAAIGLLAVPAPVRALTDLPAEWPARVLFANGVPQVAQLGGLEELSVGAAGYRQVLRPDRGAAHLDIGITPEGGLTGRGTIGQLPLRGSFAPSLPLPVRVETTRDGHLDLVIAGVKAARLFHRFGPEPAARPPAGTRAVTAKTWAGSDLWLAASGPLLPGVELGAESGWPQGVWPAPVVNLLSDQLAIAVGAGRVDLKPLGDARYQTLTLWVDPATGRVSASGEALLHLEERELRLARRVWNVPGDVLGSLEASADGVRVTAEFDTNAHGAPVRIPGPPPVSARLIRFGAARLAVEKDAHLELIADVNLGEQGTRAPLRLEHHATGPRLAMAVPPAGHGQTALGTLNVPLGTGAHLTLVPERLALFATGDLGASETTARRAPLNVEIEGDGTLAFADVSLSGPAVVRTGPRGALDLAITPPRSRLPALPAAMAIDFARTSGRLDAEGKLALTGAVFTAVPGELARVTDAFAPLPKRLTGRLTANGTAVEIAADAPATLLESADAGLKLSTTGLALRHVAGGTGWEPALIAKVETSSGAQETRLEARDGQACVRPLARRVNLAAEGVTLALDELAICLKLAAGLPAVELTAGRAEIVGWRGALERVALVRGTQGWTPTVEASPAPLEVAGARLTFGRGPLERPASWHGPVEIGVPAVLADVAKPLLSFPKQVSGQGALEGDTVRVSATVAVRAAVWPGLEVRLDTLEVRKDDGPARVSLAGALLTANDELPGRFDLKPGTGAAPARLVFAPAGRARLAVPVPGSAIAAALDELSFELARDGEVPFVRVAGSGTVSTGSLSRRGRVSLDWSTAGRGRLEVAGPELTLEAGPLAIAPLSMSIDLPRAQNDLSLPVEVKVELPPTWPAFGGQELRARVDADASHSWRLRPTGPLPGPRPVGTLPVRAALTSLEASHTAAGFALSGTAQLTLEAPLAGLLSDAHAPPHLPARLTWQAGRVTLSVSREDAAAAETRFSLPPLGRARAGLRGLTITFAGPHPEPILMVAAALKLEGGAGAADLLVSGNVGEAGLQLDLTAPDRTRGTVSVRVPGLLTAALSDLVFRELAPASEASPATGALSGDLTLQLGGPSFGLRVAGERVAHVLGSAAPPSGLMFFDRLNVEGRLFGRPFEGALALPQPPGPELRHKAAWWRDALDALADQVRAGAREPIAALAALWTEGRAAGASVGPFSLGLPAAAARLLPDLPLANMAGRTVARLTLLERPTTGTLSGLIDAGGELARAFSGELSRLVALVPQAGRSGFTRLRIADQTTRASWALEPARAAGASGHAPGLRAVQRLLALGAQAQAGHPGLAEVAQGRGAPVNLPAHAHRDVALVDSWRSLREPVTAALEILEQASPGSEAFDPKKALERHLARMAADKDRVTLDVTGSTPPIVVRSGGATLMAQSVPLLTTTTHAVPGQGTLEVRSTVELANKVPVVTVKARLLPLTAHEHRVAQASWTRARARWLAAREAHDSWQKRASAEAAWQARQSARDAWRDAVSAYASWIRKAGARDAWRHQARDWIRYTSGLRDCMKSSAAAWTGDPISADCRAKLGDEPADPGPPPPDAGEPPAAPPAEAPPAPGPRPPLSGEPPAAPGEEPVQPVRPNRPVVDLGTVATLPLADAHPRWRVTYHLGAQREMALTFSDLGTVKFAGPSGVRFTAVHRGARLTAVRALLAAIAPLEPWIFDPAATPFALGLATWNQAVVGWRDRLERVQVEGPRAVVSLKDGARLTLSVDEAVTDEDTATPLTKLVHDAERRELSLDGVSLFGADADTRRVLAEHARKREELEPSTLDRFERMRLNLDGQPLSVRRLHVLYDHGPLRAALMPGKLAILEGATGTPLVEIDRGSLGELARLRASGAPGELDEYPAEPGTFLAHAGPATATREVIPDAIAPRALGQTLPVTSVVDLHLALGSHVLERTLTIAKPADLRGRYVIHETGQPVGTLPGGVALTASGDRVSARVPVVPATGLADPRLAISFDRDLQPSASVITADGQTRIAALGRTARGSFDGSFTYDRAPATAGGLVLAAELAADSPARKHALSVRAALSSDGSLAFAGAAEATLGGRHLDGARFRLDPADGLAVSGDMWWHAARVHLEGRGSSLSGDFVNLTGETGIAGTLSLSPGAKAIRVDGQLQVAGTAVTQGPVQLEAKTGSSPLDLAVAEAGLDAQFRVLARDAPEPHALRLDGEAYLDTPLGRLAAPLAARVAADGTARAQIGAAALAIDLSTLTITVQPAAEPASTAKPPARDDDE